jgi:hypothetical protein
VNEERDKTRESQLLAQHPGLREQVESLPEFLIWRSALPKVEVDDELFYVVGGDQLKDQDQIIIEWTRRFRPLFLEGGLIDGEESE